MSFPKWAIKHKRKGTELRCFGDRYYLYRISSVWDKKKKRSRKITHEMIGSITKAEGLIPKGSKKMLKIKKLVQNLAAKEYGATCALQGLCKEVIESLQVVFPEHWQLLLVLAINRLLYQAPLKNMEFFYNESFLSESFDLSLGKNYLSNFLREFGKRREDFVKFLRRFIEGSEHIVFDVTHVLSQSRETSLNYRGYNSSHEFVPQINLFYMFSIDKKLPVYYRIFPGNIHGISALKLSIAESGVKKCIMIGDKGFCSEKNIKLLQDCGLQYILPLKRDYSRLDYSRMRSRDYNEAFDGHFFFQNRVVFYYEAQLEAGCRIVVFFDPKLRLEEEANYLRRIEREDEGYCIEEYNRKQLSFGTLAMITNMVECPINKIYEHYKTRMDVEVVFDAYKNLLHADRLYLQNNESINAWVFINHIAILMYYNVLNLLKEHKLLAHNSPQDVLIRLSRITKIKINNQWCLSEINNKTQKLLKTINIPIT